MGGVFASLEKKKLIHVAGSGQDATVTFTPEGMHIVSQSNVQETPMRDHYRGSPISPHPQMVMRDFDTLEDLIAHAGREGATHVAGADAHTKIYYPRGGQYPYEEAKVWRKGSYWHAEGPGARTGVQGLPRGATPIGGRGQHHAAERGGDRLFIGVFPTGISYADRGREKDGDYARCAFLDYDTLTLKFERDCPASLRPEIERHAAGIQARRGESYPTSSSGHSAILGRKMTEGAAEGRLSVRRTGVSSSPLQILRGGRVIAHVNHIRDRNEWYWATMPGAVPAGSTHTTPFHSAEAAKEDALRFLRRSHHSHEVHDYEAVDNHGRKIAGPFKHYSDAKQEAERARGYVKFVAGESDAGVSEARRGRRSSKMSQVEAAIEGAIKKDRSFRTHARGSLSWTDIFVDDEYGTNAAVVTVYPEGNVRVTGQFADRVKRIIGRAGVQAQGAEMHAAKRPARPGRASSILSKARRAPEGAMWIAEEVSKQVNGSTPEAIPGGFRWSEPNEAAVFTTHSPGYGQKVVCVIGFFPQDGSVAMGIFSDEHLSELNTYENITSFTYNGANLIAEIVKDIHWVWGTVDGYAESWQGDEGSEDEDLNEHRAGEGDQWMVRYVHKISPRDSDVKGPVTIPAGAFADRKKLGAALRKAGVLDPGAQVRNFRTEGDKVVVFPSMPGMTTYWHSIILTHAS